LESKPKRHPDYKKWLDETQEIDIPHIIANSIRMGTDLDWFVERNWGFILFEMKHFGKFNNISMKYPQMQNLYRLYTKLKQTTSVEFFFVCYHDIDVNDPDSHVHVFTMDDWLAKKIHVKYDKEQQRYRFNQYDMKPMKLSEFKKLIEETLEYFETQRN